MDFHRVTSASRDLIILKTKKLKQINKYFLWLFLHSNDGQKLILRTASQTGQPHLTLPAIYDLKIPNLENQDIFEKIFNKSIELTNNSIKLYKNAETLLLKELNLLNWQPKHQLSFAKNFSDTQAAERLDAEYFQLKYDEILKIINKFDITILNKEFDILSGKNFEYTDDKEIRVIKTKQLSKRYLSFEVESHTSNEIFKNSKLLEVNNRDVLFASMGVGSLGKTNIYYDIEKQNLNNFTIDSTLKIFREKNKAKINAETLAIYLSLYVGQELIYKHIIGTSGIISIYIDYLVNLSVPIINNSTQQKIKNHVEIAHLSKLKSKNLLETAKKGVELAIENSEEKATKWINEELEKINIELEAVNHG